MRRCMACMEEYDEEFHVCPHCGCEEKSGALEAYHMLPGTMLSGRYLVGKALGFGGFGVTYIGYDFVLDRKVAIKEYLPGDFSTRIPGDSVVTTYEGEKNEQFRSGLEKFIAEAQMLAKIQETNGVVQIYNSFRENNTAYIVMEYLQGKTLKKYLADKGKLPIAVAKEILHPVMTALADIHSMGIIHRDIAPDNIFLTDDGQVKLLDFGASRFATTSHSKSLSVILKPGYAPVEQYRSRGDQGAWTDVYSLAATLYKMITGEVPEDAMERIEKEELKAPSKLGVQLSKSEENAIMNALNILVEHRTKDVEQFEKELYHDEQVKLRRAKIRKKYIEGWPLWIKIVVAASLMGVVVFGGLLTAGVINFGQAGPGASKVPEGMTRVPNVVNADVPQAEGMASGAQLIFQIVDKQYSDFIPADMVLTQSIDKGTVVVINDALEVIISGGKQTFLMLDVRGMTQAEAMIALQNLGLEVSVTEEFSAVTKGAVVSQSVIEGDSVSRGDKIVLVISKGFDSQIDTNVEIEVPNFVDMSFEEAQAEAEKYGLYLEKAGTRESDKPVNTLLEQFPEAGSTVHQGDTISIVLASAKIIYRVPDVQYKDEEAAVAELKALGMDVKVVYEESKTVAKGKVISQDVKEGEEIKEGQKITLKVSSGSSELQVREWSGWVESLPANVNKNDYEVTEKTQYSYRDKFTTTSSENSMAGWTLYDSVTEQTGYTLWSDWSTNAPGDSAGRQTENQTQYRYQTKSVEKKEKNGSWSDWDKTKVTPSETEDYRIEVDTQTMYEDVLVRTEYSYVGYCYQLILPSGGHFSTYSGSRDYWKKKNPKYADENPNKDFCEFSTQPSAPGTEYSPSDFTYYDNGWWYWYDEGQGCYRNETPVYESQQYTAYRSRKVKYVYEDVWSDWSGWSEKAVKANDSRNVETRTVYRYRDQQSRTTYYFYTWSDWTGFSDEKVDGSDTREVQQKKLYRYRQKN